MSATITAAINGYATQHEYDIISEPLEINGGVYYHLFLKKFGHIKINL